MPKGISYRDYWREVASTAKEIAKEARDQEENREWAFDRLHEWVDGHEWIIYTWANPYVLVHSSSEDAYFDNIGPLKADSYSDAMQKMAFYAFHQDVIEALEETLKRAGID